MELLALFLFLLAGLFLYLLPIILIMRSERTSGREKLVWVLLVLFVSWFAWVFYLLLAPLDKRT